MKRFAALTKTHVCHRRCRRPPLLTEAALQSYLTISTPSDCRSGRKKKRASSPVSCCVIVITRLKDEIKTQRDKDVFRCAETFFFFLQPQSSHMYTHTDVHQRPTGSVWKSAAVIYVVLFPGESTGHGNVLEKLNIAALWSQITHRKIKKDQRDRDCARLHFCWILMWIWVERWSLVRGGWGGGQQFAD